MAAAGAAEESRRATHAAIRHNQARIAIDEARHAELAWDVMAWTLAVGGAEVRSALHAVAEASPPSVWQDDITPNSDDKTYEAFGILAMQRQQALAWVHRQRSLERLQRLLA